MNGINGAGYNPAIEDVPNTFEEGDEPSMNEIENELVVVEFSEEEVQQLGVGDEIYWTVMLKDGRNIDLLFKQIL